MKNKKNITSAIKSFFLKGKNLELENKKVTVIVPNFNYAEFLPERLESIFKQTYYIYEIIILDDASKDKSDVVISKYIKKSPFKIRYVTNEKNSGSVFKQWIKGINLAKGDYIWIAEADDSCKNSFLRNIMRAFDDEDIMLAYSQSQIIDSDSLEVDYSYLEYTNDISKEKWLRNYFNKGETEVITSLAIKNTIPNVSAVVFKKSALNGLEKIIENYNFIGDWLAYVYVLQFGKIAFLSETLNYHRRHSKSVISKNEKNIKFWEEMISIRKFICDNYFVSKDVQQKMINGLISEYRRLGCEGYNDNIFDNELLLPDLKSLQKQLNEINEKYIFLNNTRRKKILFVLPDYEMGGGQIVAIRLANFFATYHHVYIYNARPWLMDSRFINLVENETIILESNGQPTQLAEYIQRYEIDFINTHVWWSDKILYESLKYIKNNNFQWAITMHGCYEFLKDNLDVDKDFNEIVKDIFNSANKIIYTAEKNLQIINERKLNVHNKLIKIYNGYEKINIKAKLRCELGIKEDAFVFGQVSRPIDEKGWEIAIQAFMGLDNCKDVHLILVAEGDYLDKLHQKYSSVENIHYINHMKEKYEWLKWVQIFDVGLLPTYFKSESLPTAIVEYLAFKKPVIATNIGEIKNMLIKGEIVAGTLIELQEQEQVVKLLREEMERFISNEEMVLKMKENTKVLFDQFDMKNCANKYVNLFIE